MADSTSFFQGKMIDGDTDKALSKVLITLKAEPYSSTSVAPVSYSITGLYSSISFEATVSILITNNEKSAQLTDIDGLVLNTDPVDISTSNEILIKELISKYEKNYSVPTGTFSYEEKIDKALDSEKYSQTTETNDKGEWSISVPTSKIKNKKISLLFSKEGYESKNIDNPTVTRTESINFKPYEISKDPIPFDQLKPLTQQILKEQTGLVLVRERELESSSFPQGARTAGWWYYKGKPIFPTVEDKTRTNKVYGATAIPANGPDWNDGKPYDITLTFIKGGTGGLIPYNIPLRGLGAYPAPWSSSETRNVSIVIATSPGSVSLSGPGNLDFGGIAVHGGANESHSEGCVITSDTRTFNDSLKVYDGAVRGRNKQPTHDMTQLVYDNRITTIYVTNDFDNPGKGFYDSGVTNDIYEIPRLTLISSIELIKSNSRILKLESTLQENKIIINSLNHLKLSSQDVLVNHINSNRATIKQTLIPAVIKLIAPFGTSALQAAVGKIPTDSLSQLVNCPSSNNILQLIRKRNLFVKQINNIYNTIKTLTALSAGATVVITAIQTGITLAKLSPYPAPPSVTLTLTDLQSKLKKASVTLSSVTLALAGLGVILGIVLKLLETLDQLLQQCSTEQDIPYETINNELNEAINVSTGVNNSQVINGTQNDNIYKDFKLELKLDETNGIGYPRRYAQALNKQGVAVLKTDPSFASDPQVLLDNLKFIIDSNPNITPE